MTAMLARVMGRKALSENDVVPVIANVPRKVFQDRQRKREYAVRRTLGEAQGDVIPDDAEEIEDRPSTLTTKLRPIKDVVQEPSYPSGDKENYMSPMAALTAPDATPKSMTPTDPSSLPGVKAGTFRSKDAQNAKPEELSAPNDGMDKATKAMDVLLGRARTGTPPKDLNDFQESGKVTSEAQALAMIGAGPSGEALLGQGVEMAPPVLGDGKTVYEAARRFI